jgi:hypothetical protein
MFSSSTTPGKGRAAPAQVAQQPPLPHASPIAQSLDSLATWRARCWTGTWCNWVARWPSTKCSTTATPPVLAALRERLASEKLVLAFVAEFSRGKSELINAIFFRRRRAPRAAGHARAAPRCARWNCGTRPTRRPAGAAAHRDPPARACRWPNCASVTTTGTVPLDPGNPASLVQALAAVTRTQRVSVAQAAALGFWDESQPDDNPPTNADGTVDVPAWRHAVINYPHPLLQRGLVVIDTPGLNAIGAEPELTLGLLPSAHAVVFVLAADTGVTRPTSRSGATTSAGAASSASWC